MSARPQFTITLGGGDQVIKRARPAGHGDYADDDKPSFGAKRPIRERLESNMANSNSYGNKRQRTEGRDSRFVDTNLMDRQIKDNQQVGKNDLRWKLIQKGLSRRRHIPAEQRDVDLREKLSRSAHASSSSTLRTESRRHQRDAQQHVTESSTSGLESRLPSRRTPKDLYELDSHRRSYSLAFDRQKHNSPGRERLISAPRHLSPLRRYGELQHSSMMRTLDTSRPNYLTNGGVGDASSSLSFLTKNTTSVDLGKSVARASAPGPIGQSIILKHEEPLTVAGLLSSLGLGKYAILFQAEEVDMPALKQMGDSDLKEMGIPMGPRKKILLAAASHPRPRPQR